MFEYEGYTVQKEKKGKILIRESDNTPIATYYPEYGSEVMSYMWEMKSKEDSAAVCAFSKYVERCRIKQYENIFEYEKLFEQKKQQYLLGIQTGQYSKYDVIHMCVGFLDCLESILGISEERSRQLLADTIVELFKGEK